MKSRVQTKNRRGQQSTVQVSLFPFLAVLICTMGSLILLLVVIARQANLHAAQVAEAEATEQDAEQQKERREAREDVQWQIEQLKAAREATDARVAESRTKLGHIEDHARRLRQQMARLEAALADLDKHGANEQRQRSELEAELAKAKTDIEAAEKQLEEARLAVGRRPRSYAVVPYKGRYETRRCPIYIECTDDAVTLRPEGIVLSPTDFNEPLGPGNPLAAALRATREYLLSRKEFDPQSAAGEPYPLLLVRPSGVAAYYAARTAMQSWGSEFGYELIDEDWKLKFRKPDPELAQVIRRAIEIARLRQRRLAIAAPRSYRNGAAVQYRAGRSHGIVPDGVITGDEGRGSRHFGGTFNDRFGSARSSQRSSQNGGNSGLGGYQAAGGQTVGRQAGNSPYSHLGSGKGGHGGGLAAGRGNGLAAGQGNGGGVHGSGTGAAGGGRVGSTGNGVGGKGPGGPNAEGSNFGTATPGATGQGGSSAGSGDRGDRSGASDSGASAGNSPGGGSGTGGSRGGSAASGATAGGSSSGGSGGAGGASGGTSGAAGPSFGMPGQKKANAADPAAQGTSVSAMRKDSYGDTSEGASQPGQTSPDQWRRSPGGASAPGGAGQSSCPRPAHSMASSRGQDWGLQDTGGAIAITRPVRIECHPDRLVVATRRRGGGKTIPFGVQTLSAVDEMVFDVWQYVETWGIAGNGMYWRPVLKVYVAPGAERRFEDLNLLLEDSGLTVERKK